jgi:hypothetical protein
VHFPLVQVKSALDLLSQISLWHRRSDIHWEGFFIISSMPCDRGNTDFTRSKYHHQAPFPRRDSSDPSRSAGTPKGNRSFIFVLLV